MWAPEGMSASVIYEQTTLKEWLKIRTIISFACESEHWMGLAGCFLLRVSLEVAVRQWLKLIPSWSLLNLHVSIWVGHTWTANSSSSSGLSVFPTPSSSLPSSLPTSLSNSFSHLHMLPPNGCLRIAGLLTWGLKAPRASPKRNWQKWHGLF